MERIDRQQRFIIKTPISAVSDGHPESPGDTPTSNPDSHWLSHAMAMWIQQDETLAHADREPRRGDASKR